MKKLIEVDHGLDNYAEILDVSKIIFVRADWESVNDTETWQCRIIFENGVIENVRLSPKGYSRLKELLAV